MINHRFYNELLNLERTQVFCGERLSGHYSLLIIGTFNPDDNSVVCGNNAEWFYGRTEDNYFWRYLPQAHTGKSLHPIDGHLGGAASWRQYCLGNRVVIIDMIKQIDHPIPLPNFKDRSLNERISPKLQNVSVFDVVAAFDNITFSKVIYSLKWTDARNIPNLVSIRDKLNSKLVRQGSIRGGYDSFRYCKAPWYKNAYQPWYDAINH